LKASVALPALGVVSGCGGFLAIPYAPRQLSDLNAVFSETAKTILLLTKPLVFALLDCRSFSCEQHFDLRHRLVFQPALLELLEAGEDVCGGSIGGGGVQSECFLKSRYHESPSKAPASKLIKNRGPQPPFLCRFQNVNMGCEPGPPEPAICDLRM
jgi:hypothetical protein